MAQYTPNFNLYEPDSSYDFADFRTEFNNNMDIIDQNLGGGGGSGGHTIYDKDGNALAQESGLQFTGNVNVSDDSGNGRTVVDITGGGGNVYGFAIDESRKLFEGTLTNFTQTLEYTATEDAIALVDYSGSNGTNQWFLINGVIIPFQVLSSGRESFTVPIRKGDKISARHSSDNEGCFFHLVCYGIKQGTNGIYAPVIYSDNERVIGVWRDNKPLYQRTFVLSSPINVNGSGTLLPNDIQTALADVEIMVDSECARDSTYSAFISPYVYKSGGQWYILSADNWGNVKFITLRYTKTTDVAGSGNWNTDGVPTVHYSTSEQVIGTYFGKPLYEKTWDNLSIAINGDNWVYFNDPVDIDNVVSFVACYQGANGFLHCAISEYQRSNSNGIMFAGFNGFNGTVNRITAQYTKTTDT